MKTKLVRGGTTRPKRMAGNLAACAGRLLPLLLFCALPAAVQAQIGPISLVNAHVADGYFQFELVVPAGSECEAESADTVAGPWRPMPGTAAGQAVRALLDRAQQFFRARCGTSYSANLAGYVTLRLPSGFSAVANPFNQGGNPVAELLPAAPMVLFKFDAMRQTYTANQFDFGVWARPSETLAPGEGAWLWWGGPGALEVTFGGLVPDRYEYPALEGGWNFISSPILGPALPPSALTGDRVAQWTPGSGLSLYELAGGKWTPTEPVTGLGEGLWYMRNLPNPNAPPPAPLVYLNNHVATAAPPIDAPLYDSCGCPMRGTNWLAQLYAAPAGGHYWEFQPAGDPLPFREGIGAGYLDISSGAVRRLPGVSPGQEADVDIRVWDPKKGANFEAAQSAGGAFLKSNAIRVRGYPPPASPSSLPGLQTFGTMLPRSLRITQHPTPQYGFLGGTAGFAVSVEVSGFITPQPSYRWQKASPSAEWVDLPGATTWELIVHPIDWESAGDYRAVVGNLDCPGHECAFSQSARLRVIEPPRLTGAAWNTTSGTFAFILTAEPGYDYAVEASTNLTTWATYETVTNLVGPRQIVVPGAGPVNERYYRARVLNP